MNPRELDWALWMQAANRGDDRAYERCLRQIADSLRSSIRAKLFRFGSGDADLEDIVQTILLAIHLKRHSWDETRPIGPWLSTIAKYKFIDFLRRTKRMNHVPIDDYVNFLAAPVAEASVYDRDVDKALSFLSSGQRAVVEAISLKGASISEAALQLGLKEGAVRVALHRGLAALAKKRGDLL